MRLKRYWLFEYEQYEASGGMSDFTKDYESLTELLKDIGDDIFNPDKFRLTIYDIYDSEINEIILNKYEDNIRIYKDEIVRSTKDKDEIIGLLTEE